MARPLLRHRSRKPLPRCDKPLVIAHRGASYDAAEHTLPAYVAALDEGADGLECDVRLTKDGHLVCVHDRTVNRTSNGSGIVSEYELAALRKLDFQSWREDLPASPDELLSDSPYLAGVAPDRLAVDSSHVLTLDALLAVVPGCRPAGAVADRDEASDPVRRSGREGTGAPAASVRLGPATNSPVTVMSFAQVALRRVRLLAPELDLVLLLLRESSYRRNGALPTGVQIAGPGIRLLREDPEFVERVHTAGNKVYCWTVDRPEDVVLVEQLGIDAIITNRPRELRAQLGYS